MAAPIVTLGDTLTATAALLATRWTLLLFWRRLRAVRFVATWIGRLAAVAVLLPALRLFALAIELPAVALPAIGVGLGLLIAGVLLVLVDRAIVAALRRRGDVAVD